jgi:hypothetical protein
MMRNSMLAVALGTAVLAACAANPAPVPLTADPEGQALVIGEWSGDYYTSDGGRAGSILLRFERHDTSEVACFGDVVMVPRVAINLPPDEGRDANMLDPVRVLSIEHVDVQGHNVSGEMAPYTDPETGENLRTWFEGRISGDTIEGTLFTIHARSGEQAKGRWQVTRTKSSRAGS